jgi:predicted amidohydrolase YtcJ
MTAVIEAPRRVLLRNGTIYAPGAGKATAMLTVGRSVAAVGSDDAVAADVGTVDSVIDLDGRLVTPAFVDAHVHLSMTGRALAALDLSSCDSLAEALVEIEAYASTLSPDAVLFASGWDESSWPERRPPSLTEIDNAARSRIVYAARVDSHSAVVSSALLAKDPALPTLAGWRGNGAVERDAHHAAREVVRRLWTVKERTEALRRALRFAASQGIGCVHELNAPHIAAVDDFTLLNELAASEPLPEVVCYWGELFGGDVPVDAVQGFAGDLTVDGSIGSRTARLRESYADSDDRGHLYLDAGQIGDHVAHCTRSGVQAGFHVIGDAALDEVVDGLRRAAAAVGRDAMVRCRHRLEHVEMPSSVALVLMEELGVVASVQPAFDAAWGAAGGLYEQRLGGQRSATMNPFADFRDAGVELAFGSDSPVTPLDSWAAVRAAVCHSRPEQRLDAATAFAAATVGGHRAARRDDVGMLIPGKSATYAVWDVAGDLHEGLPDFTDTGTSSPRCTRTVVAGTEVFTASEEHQ